MKLGESPRLDLNSFRSSIRENKDEVSVLNFSQTLPEFRINNRDISRAEETLQQPRKTSLGDSLVNGVESTSEKNKPLAFKPNSSFVEERFKAFNLRRSSSFSDLSPSKMKSED